MSLQSLMLSRLPIERGMSVPDRSGSPVYSNLVGARNANAKISQLAVAACSVQVGDEKGHVSRPLNLLGTPPNQCVNLRDTQTLD